MDSAAKVLVIDAGAPAPSELEASLRARGFAPVHVDPATPDSLDTLLGNSLAVVRPECDQDPQRAARISELLQRLVSEHVATLVWGPADQVHRVSGPLVEWLPAEVGIDEVVGKIGTLAHYAPLIKGFERELQHMHRLGEQLNHYFGEIDQEMRLAGRLQRDFLPRQLPNVDHFTFQAVYRPASWVSGDMYDVFRIDEDHLGMFVADAMGHGVAAGLLTMFLRQALVVKRVDGGQYSIVAPAEALDNLNNCLVRQKLPNCQFVTAAYAILNTRTWQLQVARAGHPYPIRVDRNGQLSEIRSDGSLLGLADVPAEFEQTACQLEPGDKVILYTDGIEDVVLDQSAHGDEPIFTDHFQQWVHGSAGDFLRTIEAYLDQLEGSLHPADDITILTVEVA